METVWRTRRRPNRPDTVMHAKFPVMQTWWGEVELKMKASKDSLIFYRYAPKSGTRVLVKFNAKDQDGTLVRFSLPIHFFSKIEHTERDGTVELPTALVFHLTHKGFERIVKKLPEIVKIWGPKLESHRRELSKTICFVLDPSYVCIYENEIILYRPQYLDILKNFKTNYNEEWENHLVENKLMNEEYENRIVPINKLDFDAYSKSHGLRNVDSKIQPNFRKHTIRIFKQRRNVKRNVRKRGSGRRSGVGRKSEANDSDEEEEGSHHEGEEEQDSIEYQEDDESDDDLKEGEVDEEEGDYDKGEVDVEDMEVDQVEPEAPKEHTFAEPKSVPRRKRR